MRTPALAAAAALACLAAAAPAQTTPSITFYELPGYLGRSVTVTTGSADLSAQGFAKRARSARVVGEWQVCGAASYADPCQTLRADAPLLSRSAVVSARPAGAADTAVSTTSAAASAAVDLDTLDAGAGTSGQDVSFYAEPTIGGSQVSAGSNDSAAAALFCKQAGAASAAYASRGRVQASGLIDLATKTRVRAFPLRDVLCKR